ncbi:hypothetical protein DFQ28_002288 [Apophysomyces sp. BC1034]|nr:hypothetical protein DFQ28_002288 [Apophysomyces sp. BC1034]
MKADRRHTLSVPCHTPKCTSRPLGDTGGKMPRRRSLPTKKKDAMSLFGHLSKEELIRRVVNLENQKRMGYLNSQANTTPPSPLPSEEDEEESFSCHWAKCHCKMPTLDQLMTHLREEHIGSGKAAYHCEWSGCPRKMKPFMKRHKMHNHMRTHTGEKPYVCTVQGCDKRFSRLDSLNTHIRTHSDVRPYVCPFQGCGKAYFHSRSLRKHTKSHDLSVESAECTADVRDSLQNTIPTTSSIHFKSMRVPAHYRLKPVPTNPDFFYDNTTSTNHGTSTKDLYVYTC